MSNLDKKQYEDQLAQKELELAKKDSKIEFLEFELEQLKKAIIGSKRERFVPTQTPGQGSLFEDLAHSQEEPQKWFP